MCTKTANNLNSIEEISGNMEFKAAKLVVQDTTYVNLSWSHPEVQQNAVSEDASATETPQQQEEKTEDPAETAPQEGILGRATKWLTGALTWSTEKASKGKTQSRRHYVFVLDTSGSMGGDPIETVKETVISFQEMLNPEDLFSIVTFSNSSRLLFHQYTSANSVEVNESVQSMTATGGTNLCAGLCEGLQAMTLCEAKYVQNVLVLLSDGCANVGTTKQDEIVQSIQSEADRNLAVIYSIGIGHSYNNDLLQHLTSSFSGVHYHLDSSENIPYVIGNIMGDIQPVLFKDVVLTVSVPPRCIQELQFPNHLQCEQTSEGIIIYLSSLRAKDSHNINACLKGNEVSNFPSSFSVKLQAFSVERDTNIEETLKVNVMVVDDENHDHDVYRSNFARILFVSETKGRHTELTLEKLNSLKSKLKSLPRYSENPTISQVLTDVEDLIQSLQHNDFDDPGFEYTHQSIQSMHGKARGCSSRVPSCNAGQTFASPYESAAQQMSSASMSAKVASRKSARRDPSNNAPRGCPIRLTPSGSNARRIPVPSHQSLQQQAISQQPICQQQMSVGNDSDDADTQQSM